MSVSNVASLKLAAGTRTSVPMTQDVAILDFPLSGKAREDEGLSSSSSLSSSDSEADDEKLADDFNGSNTPTPTHSTRMQSPSRSPTLTVHPRFSRGLSTPLASQLGHLRHPHRLTSSIMREPLSQDHSSEMSQFRELSLELADSVQVMIQTLLQLSPPHILDPAKEHISACSLSIPTPCISAMFTAMKNLNYISANIATFCLGDSEHPTVPHNDFDIGEILQSVGDTLSGTASHCGVELVLYHADVGLKHVWVKGDESGLSYLLTHIVRQILSTARRGDSIELGLHVGTLPRKQFGPPISASEEEYRLTASPSELDGPLKCTIQVSHKYFVAPSESQSDFRAGPVFSSLLLRRLISKVGATFIAESIPASSGAEWTCELSLILERGATPATTPALGGDDRVAIEPTIDQLTSFVESLKGKKVTLYASSKGSFAHHLTSYLTAWGLDVSHGDAEGAEGQPEFPLIANGLMAPPLKPESRQNSTQPQSPSFIFIDDDVTVLKQRLNALRIDQPQQFNLRKRPSLAQHRAYSSTQVARARGQSITFSSVVVVHFASLANLKIIKDVIQSVLTSYVGSTATVPEVMIIPKPAGPRRLLTALHTAHTKPIVDPFFSPIATSPVSPGVFRTGSFIGNTPSTSSPKSPLSSRPIGSRSNSDRSTRSNATSPEHPNLPQPSPLGMLDNVEYFSDAALGTSPSSGYWIQNPDGKPTGIFFHPNPKSGPPRLLSGVLDRSRPIIPSSRPSRNLSNESGNTVAFLHETTNSSRTSPTSLAPRPSVNSVVETETSPLVEVRNGSVLHQPTSPTSPEAKGPPLLRSIGRRTTSGGSGGKPASSTTPNKKTKTATESNIVPPVSVLIVDDNPINQTILSTFMKKKKIKYDVASNGAEAVDKWRTGGFHLILMDIQMPVMDGIEATKEIRRLEKSKYNAGYIMDEQSYTPRTPSESSEARPSPYRSSVIIVALTASSLQSDRVAALAAGCNDFLTKPVSLQWLNNKIIEWGSIKALQMWADPGPELANTQEAKAKNVAERLHVPETRKPSPSRPPNLATNTSSPATATVPPATTSALGSAMPNSAVSVGSSAYWSAGQPSPPTFWAHMGVSSSPLAQTSGSSQDSSLHPKLPPSDAGPMNKMNDEGTTEGSLEKPTRAPSSQH